jgi:hypothetical protein
LLLEVDGLQPAEKISATTLFELLKISFAVVAGLGGLVALLVAYRRQKVTEAAQKLAEAAHALARQGEERAHRSEAREATKLHNDRFATAAGQLGHDSPAVRLAGVHALAGLADDAPTRELRQTCIDVLCAYLRMPYASQPEDDAPEKDRLTFAGLQEVRHTIIRLITAHLREGATVSWQGHDLDFTGVVFDGGDFTNASFSSGKVSFAGARFSGGHISFNLASFSGGHVSFAAEFSGGRTSRHQCGGGGNELAGAPRRIRPYARVLASISQEARAGSDTLGIRARGLFRVRLRCAIYRGDEEPDQLAVLLIDPSWMTLPVGVPASSATSW